MPEIGVRPAHNSAAAKRTQKTDSQTSMSRQLARSPAHHRLTVAESDEDGAACDDEHEGTIEPRLNGSSRTLDAHHVTHVTSRRPTTLERP